MFFSSKISTKKSFGFFNHTWCLIEIIGVRIFSVFGKFAASFFLSHSLGDFFLLTLLYPFLVTVFPHLDILYLGSKVLVNRVIFVTSLVLHLNFLAMRVVFLVTALLLHLNLIHDLMIALAMRVVFLVTALLLHLNLIHDLMIALAIRVVFLVTALLLHLNLIHDLMIDLVVWVVFLVTAFPHLHFLGEFMEALTAFATIFLRQKQES